LQNIARHVGCSDLKTLKRHYALELILGQTPLLVQAHARLSLAINSTPADSAVGLKAAIYVAEKFGRRRASLRTYLPGNPSLPGYEVPAPGGRVIHVKPNIGNAKALGDALNPGDSNISAGECV